MPAVAALLTLMEARIPLPLPADLVMLAVGERARAGDFSIGLAVLALETGARRDHRHRAANERLTRRDRRRRLRSGRGTDAGLPWARASAQGFASISIHTVEDIVKNGAKSHRLRVKPASPPSWLRASTTARVAPLVGVGGGRRGGVLR